MRLREQPRPEDLEIVTYWVKENGRRWPVDDDNNPLDTNSSPLNLDTDGNLAAILPTDPQEGEDFDSGAVLTVADADPELPERLIFKLRMLQGHDENEITQAMMKTKTTYQGRRGKKQRARVETETDLGAGVTLKLIKGIYEWEGIEDENGNPAEINEHWINLLPGWIQKDLADQISEISGLVDDEEEGE